MNDASKNVQYAYALIHLPESVEKATLSAIEEQRQAGSEESKDPNSNERSHVRLGSGTTSNPAPRKKIAVLGTRKRLTALAACFVLLACLVAGAIDFLRPVAYVDIDANPSVEVALNRFDVVVSAQAFNDDGQRALDSAKCLWKKYDEAAPRLNSAIRTIAGDDALIEVSIDCNDSDRYQSISSCSTGSFSVGGEMRCGQTDASERQEAHDAGMGVGKYRAYCYLRDCGNAVSAEECAGMTMRELDGLCNQQAHGHGSNSADDD